MPFRRFFIPLLFLPAGCARGAGLEISGSFFPAWLLAILAGIAGTLVARAFLVRSGLDAHLKPHLPVYGCLALALTLLVWLLLFS